MELRNIIYSFYVIFLLLFTLYIGVKPYYNMDMLPYMAIVQKMDGKESIQQIHASTYQEVKGKVSSANFQDLVSATDYRKIMFENEDSFNEQLSFYVIKPLYLLSAFLFYKLGFDLSFSTVLPSLISFFIIGLLTLKWINKVLPSPWLTLWACLFIITSQPFITLGKSAAPDGLATVFLLAGCYMFIEKRFLWRSTFFFVLAILTRPDYIIVVSFLFMIVLAGKWYRNVTLMQLAACFCLLVTAYFVPKMILGGGAWSTLFYHAFIERNSFPVSDPQAPSVGQYLEVIAENVVDSTYFSVSYLLLMVLFAGTVLWDRFRFPSLSRRDWTFHQAFMLAIVATTVIRFFLFPAFLDRFMAPLLLLATIIFIKEVYPWLTIKISNKAEKATEIYVES